MAALFVGAVMENIFEYAPIIYMDRKEPIKIKKVGYRIYEKDGEKSDSFNRSFDFQNHKGTVKVIEYAYYLDYDIQHLYDLEHIWIYIDVDGNIVGAEGSYHGRFLNAILFDVTGFADKGKRIKMYSQPGKHAMLAAPRLMFLYPELFESCQRLAGISGLDAPERYLVDIHITKEENQKVIKYIRDNFSFVPSMEFEEYVISEDDYMPWNELAEKIPQYIQKQLDIIL